MTSEDLAAGRWSAAAAGRLVMDVMQSEWEPLSHCELEQRLDQAVEEILEAELMSGVQGWGQGQSRSVYTRVSRQEETITRTSAHAETSHTSTSASLLYQAEGEPASENQQHVAEIEENPTVQKLKWRDSQRRLKGRSRLSLSHTVFLSLTLLSTHLSYRSVSSTFRLEKGNIHRIFFSFCHRVNTLQDQIIRWPTGQEASDLLLPFSSCLGYDEKLQQKGLPKVLGVLGHTRIPFRFPPGKQDSESDAPHAKRLRKGSPPDHWLNLELVCDAEGRFIHCSVSQGSHRNPGEALSHILAQNPELLPPGTCLLAGAGYPLTRHILTPFRTARNPQENLYNRVLETHLRRLEQAMADLKKRFRRLSYLDVGKCERAAVVVLTCCILHTALLDAGYTTTGQVEIHTRVEGEEEEEKEEEGVKEEAGVKLREMVINLLYGALDSGTQEHEEHDGHEGFITQIRFSQQIKHDIKHLIKEMTSLPDQSVLQEHCPKTLRYLHFKKKKTDQNREDEELRTLLCLCV
ncbi:uncharacterized protein LOC131363970 isoform X2 [Hemibagrus wyckioides]|uniref:uncharacterized protein LOC131363970 isoform X2 n=1 Tax=Hemibagrus wyckioides TaxID=337641 RepID=UPI00266D28CA|nr:uncharacterized protein LOC131363970 isoform X2 [Hemibagrus wyckioides]